MSKWHYISILGLALVLTIILWQAPPSILLELADKAPEQAEQFPDSYLIKTKTTQYNEQGQVSHILLADRINYFKPNQRHTERYATMESPRFTFFNHQTSSALPWNISSNSARSRNNDEELLLTGNVILIQKAEGNGTPTTITTEQLLIKPNEQYAETNKPVIIKDQSGTTSSIGLKMSLDKETIELLSTVRSYYESR